MKWTQLLLHALFVAVGILVYDAARSEGPAASLERTPVEAVGDVSEPREPPPPPRLEGLPLDERLPDLERRLRALESALEGRLEAGVTTDGGTSPDAASPDGGGTGATGDPEAPRDATAFLPRDAGGPGQRPFEPEDVQAFRSLLELVEREREQERAANRMRWVLARLGLDLSEAQQQEVVRTSLEFQAKVRAEMRALRGSETPPEQRRETLQRLRDEYQQSLAAVVPVADAERIVAGVSRSLAPSNRRPGSRRGADGDR